MTNKARIEIRAKDVQGAMGISKHLYIVFHHSNGTEWIIRAGAKGNDLIGSLSENIEVVSVEYTKEKNKLHHDWDKGISTKDKDGNILIVPKHLHQIL